MARVRSALLCLGALLTTACAGARYETVTYPPRVDLRPHEMIGIIEFDSPEQRDLGALVTPSRCPRPACRVRWRPPSPWR